MTERRVIFWLPEGPLLAVRPNADPCKAYSYVIEIEDLNPDIKTKWALSRKDILRIAFGLMTFAIRGR